MDILLLDRHFQTIQIIDDHESLTWHRCYSQVGDFSLYTTTEIMQSVKQACYLFLSDNKELGLIENIQLTDKKLIVRGRFYDAVYDRELVYPTRNYYNDYPDEIIEDLVGQYFPDIEVVPHSGHLGARVTAQYTGKSVLEVIEQLCTTQNLGFYTTLDSSDNSLHLILYEGKNRLPTQSENTFVSFSQNFETVDDYVYTRDTKSEKNYALVAGEGEGDDRVTTTVDLRSNQNEPRKMLWVDARDLQKDENTTDAEYLAMLQQRGREKLAEKTVVQKVEITPVLDNLVYKTDYDLGDLCAVDLMQKDTNQNVIYRINLDKRIREIDEVYEKGYRQIKLVLGEQYQTVNKILSTV